ncbi:CHAT, partial [Cordylochernes scorpioides]
PENADNLKFIETSLGVLCLDPPLDSSASQDVRAKHLLDGGGAQGSGANRWYDKFFEVVVAGEDTCGVLAEHSASEGVTVLRYCQDLLDFLNKGPACEVEPGSKAGTKVRSRVLKWTLTPALSTAVHNACKDLDKLASNLDLKVLRFTDYGKELIKSKKTSPDVWVQLALQLTFFSIHHRLGTTYESASLRQFRHGRVDNIRAATPEALLWAQAMEGKKLSLWHVFQPGDIKSLFQEAVRKQTEVLLYTIRGYGTDNHLVGLKEMARLHNLPEPQFFQDPLYKVYWDFKLATSQLATNSGTLVGYGSVVPDGYGCSYTILDNEIIFCVTSFFNCPDTRSELFAHILQQSLVRMLQF